MNIAYIEFKEDRFGLEFNGTGNSKAFYISDRFEILTVLLSNVQNGSATLKYTLSDSVAVKNDTAHWHEWSVGPVATIAAKGTKFDSPVRFLKIEAGSNINYRLEVLI